MNVLRFSRFKLSDIPSSLRKLADDIEANERDAIRVVVCMETSAGGTDYAAFGQDFSYYRAIGILHHVIHTITMLGR